MITLCIAILTLVTGDLHEMRPILPPWELLYQWFPNRVEKHIRQSAQNHLVRGETGETAIKASFPRNQWMAGLKG